MTSQPAASRVGAPPATPTVSVTLEESERVTAGGTTTVTYSVLRGRDWFGPGRLAGALVEQLPREPQVIWHRRITVGLPVGTVVERVTLLPQPRARATTADVLLGKAKGQGPRTRRDGFLVGPKGSLVPR